MRPFIFKRWHAWQNERGAVLLSDEDVKKLRQFRHVDDCIDWLFLSGEREAARALNKHKDLK